VETFEKGLRWDLFDDILRGFDALESIKFGFLARGLPGLEGRSLLSFEGIPEWRNRIRKP